MLYVKESVIIIPCPDYLPDTVSKAVQQIFHHYGSTQSFVQDVEQIFIKPNILRAASPDTATTTHPQVIQQLTHALVQCGKQVTCGDSPNFITLSKMIANVYRQTGITQAVQSAGGKVALSAASVPVDGGKHLPSFRMLKDIRNSDMIINVAKAKTHAFAGYTGAVKNLFGVIPGPIKGEMHLKYPSTPSFANAMIDICETVGAALHIVDAVVGMEGPGPSSGTPRKLGVLVAGTNPYAVDEIVVELMGIDPNRVAQIKEARNRGLLPPRQAIQVEGASVDDFRASPPFEEAVPHDDFLNAFLKNVLPQKLYIQLKKKPIVHGNCTGCGICAQACPPNVIQIHQKRAVIQNKGCIKCYCCQELCPQSAIHLGR